MLVYEVGPKFKNVLLHLVYCIHCLMSKAVKLLGLHTVRNRADRHPVTVKVC
jgi:hypothetical protein